MNIKYNNSMYTINPPCIIIEIFPNDWEDEIIRNKNDEENNYFSFDDIEAERVRELVKWAKSKS